MNEAFLCLWERSKSESECSPKLEVLQGTAFKRNVPVAHEVKFSNGVGTYLTIDVILPICNPLHFSFFRLSPVVLTRTSNGRR